MTAFSLPQGWRIVQPIGGDWSTRRYARLSDGRRTAILMDCTHGKTPGHDIGDFVRIGAWLNDIGLKAPKIYEGHEKAGYLLLEDFGDVSFKQAIEKEGHEKIYRLATDVLDHLRRQKKFPELPAYGPSLVNKGHRRVIDWYLPAIARKPNRPGLVEEYLEAWAVIEKKIPPAGDNFLHIDFHVENLMFLPGEKGLKRCGILDFQGAMIGPSAYDLANLLEDARADVPLEIRQRYGHSDDAPFHASYRVLATQFHCRVIGQAVKLALTGGADRLLGYVPRLQNYIRDALRDPLLAPVKEFFDRNDIGFTARPGIQDLQPLIARDAV